MTREHNEELLTSGDSTEEAMRELRIMVPDDLFRAWQRCSWLLLAETGRSRTESMTEMVRDFLVKHGC
ncbi:MAG: hypothetical protein V2J11_03935 [Desulfofustis sp.]|jgi:hypothetical protein|nr:hypothetical protein [Desulfofustis sp.]